VVVFVDNFSRYTWVYFLKNKSEVYNVFLQFEKLIERQFQAKIRSFHSDWGGEYQKLNAYFKRVGIHHRIACPCTHEQNGTVERKIHHLIDTTLTLLAHASVSFKFWNFALEQSVFFINLLPSHIQSK
jgi:transposase InsO family protein